MKTKLYLMDDEHWQINAIKDLELFFSALTTFADSDLILCLSEGAWSTHTLETLEVISLKNYLYPVDLSEFKKCFFIEINENSILFLKNIAKKSAEPEIALHIALIWKKERILEWFDMPEDPIAISSIISEHKIRLFSIKIPGSNYKKVNGT